LWGRLASAVAGNVAFMDGKRNDGLEYRKG
jgi:hypothetical protein